jgi:hypothetical protein
LSCLPKPLLLLSSPCMPAPDGASVPGGPASSRSRQASPGPCSSSSSSSNSVNDAAVC